MSFLIGVLVVYVALHVLVFACKICLAIFDATLDSLM